MMNERNAKSGGDVLPIIRRVRRRWRLRVLLRGLTFTGAIGLVAFLLSAWLLEAARFSATAVSVSRTVAWGAVAVVALLTLVRPLFRRVSDEQVALYLEEHEPSLESAILGAMEAGKAGRSGAGLPEPLLRSLVARAAERARAVDYGRRIEERGIYRYSGALAGLSLAGVALLLLAPDGLRRGMGALLVPTTEAASVSPYAVTVEPGDITVARGADQVVRARLQGFVSDDVHLYTRDPGSEATRRLSMLPSAPPPGESGAAASSEASPGDAAFELLLLSLQEETEYFVEADGIRSPAYRIEVADLPYVDAMRHTYDFPAYTGLPDRVVEDGGDIAVLAGTEVELRVRSTLPTPAGRVVLDGGGPVELVPDGEGTLVGRFRVDAPGFYRVELARPGREGEMVEASPRYTIDVLRDLPPSVTVTRPGRDAPVSPIEEVFVEARADDDYGIGEVRLIHSVNGGPEDTTTIFQGSGSPLAAVTADHTLFLEEYPLETGDVVSYYVQARDQGPRDAWVTSDLYFLQIRPFRRDFRQAEQQQQPGGGQGGGQAGAETALSELQRQIVVGTFNVLRDREETDETTWRENLTSLALAQGRVREQVATLVERMNNRGVASAEGQFREIADMLPGALEDMGTAEELLREGEPGDALVPEQEALRVLQKAEETYERYVGQQQPQPGGGGGGQGANAEDLADLFELELDKLRNQYETVQRGQQQQADTEVDELMEKLEELARRQEQEMERQRARADAQQGNAGGGGDAQRALAEETEEAARQLERLARETGDDQLQETARRLQEAAESMRRSAAEQNGAAGAAEAGSALDRLTEAERRLRRNREDRLGDGAEDALERAERLARSQDEVIEGVEELSDDPATRREQLRRLVERKDEMLRESQELERQLDRMAADARRDDPETARALSEAAESIRESKLKEKIAWSRGVVQERDDEFVRAFEEQIAEDLDDLRQRTAEAAGSARQGSSERSARENLERARDLSRAAESMGRRLDPEARRADSSGAEEGQEGEGSDGGEAGRTGEAGESGEAGETGEGGETGQGGQGGEGGENVGEVGGDSRPTGGGATRGTPRPFTPEEIRQYRRSFEEQLQEARELRRDLAAEGRSVEELDRAIEAMRDLTVEETYGDLPQIPLLQETIRESLRRLEFTLRREVEGEERGAVGLGGSENVPEGFRELVEEYYRSLARGGGGG